MSEPAIPQPLPPSLPLPAPITAKFWWLIWILCTVVLPGAVLGLSDFLPGFEGSDSVCVVGRVEHQVEPGTLCIAMVGHGLDHRRLGANAGLLFCRLSRATHPISMNTFSLKLTPADMDVFASVDDTKR
jgi:hypothetical protein